MKDSAAFIKLYNDSFAKKISTKIVIFDRGEFYSVYGEDAHYVAKEIFHSEAFIKHLISDTDVVLDYVNINKNQFEMVIRELLLIRQYLVDLYGLQKNVRTTEETWELLGKASPGNLDEFEDILFGTNIVYSPVSVMALKLIPETTSGSSAKRIAMACVDTTKLSILVSEFSDSSYYCNLETVLVQLTPKECILPDDKSGEYEMIRTILNRSKILVVERKRSEFSKPVEDLMTSLSYLHSFPKDDQRNAAALAPVNLTHAVSCIGPLIEHLQLMSQESSHNRFHIETFTLSNSLRLDATTLKALLLAKEVLDETAGSCLFDVLNKCRTAGGQRLLEQWIKQPLIDKKKIDERLDIVEAFIINSLVRETVSNQLCKIGDLQKFVKKILRNKCTLKDCFGMYTNLRFLDAILETLQQISDIRAIQDIVLVPLKELRDSMEPFGEMIETTVDVDSVLKAKSDDNLQISPRFDEGLQELHDQIEKVKAGMQAELERAAKLAKLEVDKGIKLDIDTESGCSLRVTNNLEKQLRNNKAFEILAAQKTGTYFTTSTLMNLSDEFVSLSKQYAEASDSIVKDVVRIAGTYVLPINRLSDALAQLDVLLALAVAALSAPTPYVRPTIHSAGSGILRLKDCRHPCLDLDESLSYIPNDIEFNKDKYMFHIITGPNMGGKSTFIRQVGTVCVMAQLGSFVPCAEAELTVVDAIFTRIGASDALLKGVSTFMSEMLDSAAILQSATKDSLIIIDELGRGTSTFDGFGLAWAISEHIATNIACFCLFATHFHELTEISKEIDTINNLHVTSATNQGEMVLLYKVEQGISDKSFGIHVAELVKFPTELIEEAKQKIIALEQRQAAALPRVVAHSGVADDQLHTEAESLAKQFLSRLQTMAQSGCSEEEIQAEFEKLATDAKASNNPLILEVLGS